MKSMFAVTAFALLIAAPAAAGELVNQAGASHIGLSGYDPVAFFTDSKPAHGSPEIRTSHDGVTYLFASEEHKKQFTEKPGKYLPKYGGFCAMGVSMGMLLPVDVSTWQVRDGKLYMNFSPDVKKMFDADIETNIANAEKKWPELVKKNEM